MLIRLAILVAKNTESCYFFPIVAFNIPRKCRQFTDCTEFPCVAQVPSDSTEA